MAKIKNPQSLITNESIINKIYLIRNQKVMLDRDLANMYGIETKVLKQSVKRNMDRFPKDFMFEMSKKEFVNWRSQFVTSNSSDTMGLRYARIFEALKQLLNPPQAKRRLIGFNRKEDE